MTKTKRPTAAEWARREKYLNDIIDRLNETARKDRATLKEVAAQRDASNQQAAHYRGMLLTFVRTLSLTVDGVMAQLEKP